MLLVVTDGEPTAHLEPDGEVVLRLPAATRATVAHAVARARRVARLGAQTTFFRLGDDPGLARFVDSMARRVDGRVVAPDLDDLGAAVVGSYLGSRLGRDGEYGRLRRLVRRPRLLGAGVAPTMDAAPSRSCWAWQRGSLAAARNDIVRPVDCGASLHGCNSGSLRWLDER